MLDGWYCRSMADAAAKARQQEQATEESQCRKQYKYLKRKFKNLIYENECFKEALKTSQKKLLTVTRDRNFLLDRLLQYEKVETSSDSDATDSSDDQEYVRAEPTKKRKVEVSNNTHATPGKVIPPTKRRRVAAPKTVKQQIPQNMVHSSFSSTYSSNTMSDGHMTPEEVERHLQSRQSYMELVPERAPPTVPTEMFSNEPSLDSESNDIGDLETSPSNIGDELSIDMIPE